MNVQTQFKILTGAIRYKSVPEVTVTVTYHIVEAPNRFRPDLFGETERVVVFTQFELDPNLRAKLLSEYSDAVWHLQSLIREVILLGAPYWNPPHVVQEIKLEN